MLFVGPHLAAIHFSASPVVSPHRAQPQQSFEGMDTMRAPATKIRKCSSRVLIAGQPGARAAERPSSLRYRQGQSALDIKPVSKSAASSVKLTRVPVYVWALSRTGEGGRGWGQRYWWQREPQGR
jgi:hypothetical protein